MKKSIVISNDASLYFSKRFNTFTTNDILFFFALLTIIISISASIRIVSVLPVNAAVYAIVLSLMARNFRTDKNIRIGILLTSFLSVYALIAALINPLFLGIYTVRLLFIFIVITVFLNLRLSKKILNFMSAIMIPIICYYTIKSWSFVEVFKNSNELASNYMNSNPNSMGLIILFAFMIADRGKLLRNRLMWILISAISGIGLINYGSRNALVCFFAYILISKLFSRLSFNKIKTIYLVILAAALLFPVLYVGYYNQIYDSRDSIIVLDKDIYSGRQDIWIGALDSDSALNLIVGNSNLELLNYLPSKSLHNMYIDIGFRLGYVFLILFMAFLFYLITRDRNAPHRLHASIVVLLIYGYFETTLFSGSYAAMLMLLIFIYDHNSKFKLSNFSSDSKLTKVQVDE